MGRPAAPGPLAEELPQARRWDLIAAVAGLVFTALVIASFFTPETPATDAAADVIARDIAADLAGHRTSLLLGFLADVAILFFLGGVWGRLRRSEGRGGLFGGVFAIAAAAFVALVMVSEGLYLALVQGATTAADEPGVLRTLSVLDDWVGAAAVPAAAAMLLAAAAGIVSTHAFPQWLSWLAALTAVCLLVSLAGVFQEGTEGGVIGIFGFVGFLLVLLWALATSVVLLMRAGRTAGAYTEVHA